MGGGAAVRLTPNVHAQCMERDPQQTTAAWRACQTGCTRPGRHTNTCTDPCTCAKAGCGHCRGCAPIPAAGDAAVCRACTDRALRALDDLPNLYDALLDPSRPGGRAIGPRSSEKPLPIRVGTITPDGEGTPGPHEIRQGIGQHLARLVLTLARDYGITPPRVALHGALLAAVDDRLHAKFAAIDAGDRINHTAPGPAPDSHTAQMQQERRTREREHAEDQAKQLLRKVIAADQRITRLAGTLDRTDPVHQHARHVAVHLARLTARDDAGDTVHTLTLLARQARRAVAPARSETTALGPCPVCKRKVRAKLAQADDVVTCWGCGTSGGLDWWQATIAGTGDGWATATTAQLAAWVSRRLQRPITETTVRKWASRHPDFRRGVDSKGRTLLDVTAVIAYADQLPTATKETA